MKRPKQLFDMVELVWDDAASHENEWADTLNITPTLVLSVGFLLMCNRHYVVIAQDIDDEGGHNGRAQIPAGMVKHIKVLRKKD